jgi:hypothetical protein
LIEDPVASQHITLDSNSKTAIKMPSAQMKRADEAAARLGVPPPPGEIRVFFNSGGSGQSQQTTTAMKIKADNERAATSDLGTQTIEGVPAPDLKVLIMSKSSDPRMGETTYKLTNLSRTEPDPALFQIPADYTIKDQPNASFFPRPNP